MRPSWDEYFMEITRVVASRSTCIRRQVGCVIVKDKRLLTSGYNGAPSGLAHCSQVGCIRQKECIPSGQRQELCRGLHAEQNALVQAALHGVSVAGGTLYCTHQPCITCTKMIINAGIIRVLFENCYPDILARAMFDEADIEIICSKHENV